MRNLRPARRSLLVRWNLVRAVALALATSACAADPTSSSSGDAARRDGDSDARPAASPLGLYCSPGANPREGLITDFAAASFTLNRGRWAGDPNLTFFTYSYHDPDAPDSTNSDKVEGGVFTFSGQVVPGPSGTGYAGGGMHFDSCVNTTTYKGVQYTLTGTSGGCALYFDLQTYSQQPISERGGCASYCYGFPRKAVLPGAGPITIRFAELEGTGIPGGAAAIAGEIMGLRWQLQSGGGAGTDGGQAATCSFSLTVDDVRLVR
jgi:hypothetical protein